MSKNDGIIFLQRHFLLGSLHEPAPQRLPEEVGVMTKYILMENPWSLFSANVDLDDAAVLDQPERVGG